MSEKSNRRNFIRTSTTTAAGFMIVPRHVLGRGYVAPSDKVNIGVVGVGGRGRKNVIELLKEDDVQITALADPCEYWDLAAFYYRSMAGRGPVKSMIEDARPDDPEASEYEDFEEMLAEERDLDAILCATPDHTHAYVSIKSLQAGKHVYCEKPLTHNIWEARRVAELARETGLATQMGNQRHSAANLRSAVEHLRAGVIGDIQEIHAWVPATRWNKHLLTGTPKESSIKPVGLNWNLWLGPRADRPFHESYAPVTWRDYWDFGLGALGDFGCHDMDTAVWGLELPLPSKIQVRPAGHNSDTLTPYGEVGYYEFPNSDNKPPIRLNWYSGGLRPRRPDLLPSDQDLSSRGELYVGTEGIMVIGGPQYIRIYPESLRPASVPSVLAPTSGHHRDWIDAIKGGAPASSNFEYGAHLTEITLLGVLSLRMGGQMIDWDAKNMQARGLPEANRFIEEPVREGWEM
ncbi:MAG: Gfo/Idh/MocA family oxidoreductase [Saprospiraceae bacterium]|nr:Gfo/Idh/MocA family oxidoreductase [Saprospiraceae bacterium]